MRARSTLSWSRLQEARLALSVLAAVGVAGCSARGPQPVEAVVVTPPAPVVWAAYVVQAGDTLGRIAACSGWSVAELAQLNDLPDPDVLIVGEQLKLPEAHRCTAPPRAAKVKARLASRSGVVAARAEGRRLLDAANARNDAADFEEARSLAGDCTQRLAPWAPDPEADTIRAHCHLVAGMAEAGLDRRERAIEEFRRAFAIDPRLELSAQSSPRILELVDAAGRQPAASH